MSDSQDVNRALSLYRQLSARLAKALNGTIGTTIELDEKPAVSIIEATHQLGVRIRRLYEDRLPWDLMEIESTLWNVAGGRIGLNNLCDLIGWLEHPKQFTTPPQACGVDLGELVNRRNANEITAAFREHQQNVESYIRNLKLPRSRSKAQRDATAFDLWRKGDKWKDIAKQCDFPSGEAARQAVKRECDRRGESFKRRKGGRPKKKT
jgi:hypothetical protein